MLLPSEPIGSMPRPPELIEPVKRLGHGHPDVETLYDPAVRDTIARFEATGSPMVTDGEQRKYHNFWTYGVHGLANTTPDGFRTPFADGHVRRMSKRIRGTFPYRRGADAYLAEAKTLTVRPVKPAVISPSALSLTYPAEAVAGYGREAFIEDLLAAHVQELRACFEAGANCLQIDSTDARFAMKRDPSGMLLASVM